MMRTVYLHGILGERYGKEHHFHLSCPREAISALSANFEGFRADFHQFSHYGLVADDECRHPGNCADVATYPFSRDLHLVPMVEGRIGAFLTPLLIPIVGTVAAPIISGAITIGLLFGISLLLAPKPPEAEDEKRDENYMFSGPANIVTQGAPVPLIYGRCFVGSVVISNGLDVAQGRGGNNGEGRNYKWQTQGSLELGGDVVSPVARPVVADTSESLPAGNVERWEQING